MSAVDFTALAADPGFAADVAGLEAAARSFDRGTPVALIPVRVETRFSQVTIPGSQGTAAPLIAALAAEGAALLALGARDFATVLSGSVKERKQQKRLEEVPLYEAAEADIAAAAAHAEAVRTALGTAIVLSDATQAERLMQVVESTRAAAAQASTALAGLRSDYQRDRLQSALTAVVARLQEDAKTLEKEVLPAAVLGRELGVLLGADAARRAGRTRSGLPLRAPALPGDRLGPSARLIVGDGTLPEAMGATRAIAIDYAQLVASAGGTTLIADGAAYMKADDLVAAAAAIVVLPGSQKAMLLAALAAASATRTDLELVQSIIEAVPSTDRTLDLNVPEHLRDVVFTLPTGSRVEDRLLVRFYPEVLAVDTHEPELTPGELAAGTAFWVSTLAAGGDQTLQRGAWRALAATRSTGRAAWIAEATMPHDPGPTPGATAAEAIAADVDILVKRLDELAHARAASTRPTYRSSAKASGAVAKALAAVKKALADAPPLPSVALAGLTERMERITQSLDGLIARAVVGSKTWRRAVVALVKALDAIEVEPVPEPEITAQGSKRSTWSRAARSGVLPDRFAVITVAGGRVTHVAAARPVPADLKLSLDPDPDHQATETFALDQDGNLQVAPSIRWMVDFDEAVARGMALSLPLSAAEAAAGFDEVLVVGLAAGDPEDGAARLLQMVDAHHYTANGVELLAIGTPTNNSEAEPAGHSTADDADDAFVVERGPSLVASGPDTDGARLARALGIPVDRFGHVRGADRLGTTEARAVHAALYPATIGHAVEELLGTVIPSAGRDRLQEFASQHVLGRGLVPSFRVSDEPYGVLPAMAISRFVPDASDALGAAGSSSERTAQERFDSVVSRLLLRAQEDWTLARQRHVRHARSSDVGEPGFDAQAHFLQMLGLQGTSAASSYRFAVNVAGRGGVRGRPDLALGFGLPPHDGSQRTDPSAAGPFAVLERFADALAVAFVPPLSGSPRDGAGVAAAWLPLHQMLEESRLYGLRLMREAKPLRGIVAGQGTAVAVAALADASATALAALAQVPAPAGRPLAELLLRQGLLVELRRAAVRILTIEGLPGDELFDMAGSSAHYAWSTLSGATPGMSAWGLLFESPAEVARRFYRAFPTNPFLVHLGGVSMQEYLAERGPGSLAATYSGRAGQRPALDALDRHAAAVRRTGEVPAERLDVMVREHLDVGSHRLDAWITGLAQRRLTSLRDARPEGTHIGAFGWVEDLRPQPGRRVAATLPPVLAGRPGRPVTVDLDRPDQGFVQTPSPSHAVTTAILRGAFESQSSESSLGNEMSVNLSSQRVRIAQGLAEGVRAGNDLGALLGYRFERFLHEYSARLAGVELDAFIGPLRRAFPTVAGVDPGADTAAGRQRFVVDGLALARRVLDWIAAQPRRDHDGRTVREVLAEGSFVGYPWGLPTAGLPTAPSTAQIGGLARGIDALADALDALGDLTLGEAVHQIARGNHVRASAVLSALAEGKVPPTAEVIQTPRTGLSVSHRVLLQLPARPTSPPAPVTGWESVPDTPRSLLEPTLNAWVAGLLPEPRLIRVRVGAFPLDATGILAEVSVADLGLQPLDLLALVGPGFEAGMGELTARVLDHRRPISIEPDPPGPAAGPAPLDRHTVVPERAPQWTADIVSVADISTLLEAVHDLVARSRAAGPADYCLAGAGTGSVDSADLDARVARLRLQATAATVALARLIADDRSLDDSVLAGTPSAFVAEHASVHVHDDPVQGRVLAHPDLLWGAREEWRRAVLAAASFGVRALPPRRFARRDQACLDLLEAAQTAFVELSGRLATGGSGMVAARALLGDGVALLPRFTLGAQATEVIAAVAGSRVEPAEVDSWLEGVAAVRDPSRCLADTFVLAESVGADLPSAGIAQLPSVAGEPWVAGPLADPDAQVGRVSLAIYDAGLLPADPAEPLVALYVDGWDEVIPAREETTGIAVKYDQPDATAPQCILLAVPADRGERWSLGLLAATLHDTLELARNRSVELEHLGDDLYGQVLPLVVGELVPEAVRAGTSPDGSRVILDFAANNPRGG